MLDYDIVMVTDARLPGGTSASVAEEVRAQAAAGYRTALLQIDSSLVRHARPLSPRIRACIERGELDLLVDDTPVRSRLLVLRHPTVALDVDPAVVPRIVADERLLIANQAPAIPAAAEIARGAGGVGAATTPAGSGPGETTRAGSGPGETTPAGADPTARPDGQADGTPLRFVPAEVDAHLAGWLKGPMRWAPIGPLVRDDLARVAPELVQEPTDWLNIIDVDAWRRPRDGARHRIPVIGRHSRDDVLKWPATRTTLLAAYPAGPDVEVHVLGGAAAAEQLLGGELPDNWRVLPFGALPPARFLAGLDVYVYQHHPAWVEAFGRSILEALASGLPTVLAPHFAALFEDAAVYAEVEDTAEVVQSLHRDRDRYRELAARATDFAAARFGHGVHRERLAALIGPPSAGVAPAVTATAATGGPGTDATATAGTAGGGSAPARQRVLMVSSNGAGVGHLMRLLSYAKHSSAHVEPLFLTFSQGGRVVDDAGYLVEYLASRSISGARSVVWHPMLRARVGELIERYDVRAVVFDGTWPYQGILDAAADHPHVQLVWSRRAMWRQGVTNPVLEHERDRFDLVLEPGELAADDDHGATRRYRKEARRVGPVTYLGLEELLSPEAARAALDLDPERPAALVHLGAGNIDDAASTLGQVIARLARERDLQVRVTRSIIAREDAQLPDNVEPLSVYPLARYLPAFDLAVAAPGYNSFHELLLAAVPTVFVPNVATSTDDQGARSRFAERVGMAVDLPVPDPDSIDAALTTVLDPERRRRMRERAVARRREGGAADAMAAIEELLATGPRDRPTPLELERAAAERVAGAPSPGRGRAGARAQRAGRAASPVRPATPADAMAASGDNAPEARGAAPAARAQEGPAAAPGRAQEGPAATVRRWRKRLQRRAVTFARSERTRSRFRGLFNALPTPLRRTVRRRLRRWERRAHRSATPALEPLPVPMGPVAPVAGGTPPVPIGIVIPHTGDPAVVDRVVDRIAQLQQADRSFAPLIVVSDLAFRAARRHGYLVEYLPPRDRYERLATDQPWHDARRVRLQELVRWFALDQLLVLPRPEPGQGPEEMLAVLAAGIGTLPDPLAQVSSF